MVAAEHSEILELCKKHLGEYRIRNGQIVARFCPFCNGGDSGDTQTFSVGLYNGAFSCLRGGCSKTGSFRELCEFFGERPLKMVSMPSSRTKRLYARPNVHMLPPTAEIAAYFSQRGISERTLKAFGVCADNNGNIVFPFYRNKELIYVKYRKPQKHKKGDGPKEWSERNTEPILFGMDNVSFHQPLFITEGEIDALSLYEAGITNVVSVPCGCNNLEFVSLCWDWLEKFQQIVLFGDNDEPGVEMVSTLMKRLGEDRCMIVSEYPDLIVDGESSGRTCKDANEILYVYGKEGLKQIAESCEPAPIKGILNLADVTMVDPTTKPRIFTRIPMLDHAIGGLTEGSVTIFSGKRGEGKSTIGGQFMLNAIQQGYSVCAYSGELPAQTFLNWVMLQATEDRYIAAKADPRTGKNYAVVPYDVQRRIKDWINNKFFLFDNNYAPDIPQEEAIIKTFTLCARRYGCKLFLVDNLMTILSESSSADENRVQGKFVAALKAFAVKYKVCVLLVCHPRKTKAGEKFTSEDVAGSANITNLADTVINIEKPNLRITKNREFGICEYIICGYNPANRRIFQANIGDRTVYGWNHEGLTTPEQQACTLPEFQIQCGQPEATGMPAYPF
jgi:twinkle protein